MDFEQIFSGLDNTLLNAMGDDAIVDELVTVRGLFEAPWLQPQMGTLRTSIQEPMFTARSVDLALVTENSVLTIKGANYEVVPPFEPDGTGLTKLILRPLA